MYNCTCINNYVNKILRIEDPMLEIVSNQLKLATLGDY